MSEGLLQSLLAVRKACAELKGEVSPAARARIDIVNTVLARLIVDAREGDALAARFGASPEALAQVQGALRDARLAGLTSDASGHRIPEVLGQAMAYASAEHAAISDELLHGESLGATLEPQDDVFDRTAFVDFVVRTLREDPAIEVVDVALASRGFSKKTLLVSLRGNRVLPSALALRVDRPFNFLETTVLDEFEPLVALHRAGVRLPQPFALEASGKVLDGPFIVFEKKPGGLIGNNFSAPARNPDVGRDVARCLAQLHRVSPEKLPALRGAGLSAREQTLTELEKSWAHWAALKHPVPLIEAAFNWLWENVDRADGECAVVHGDFNFNNLLIDGDRVSAIVDWEFVHWGPPAADLGWFCYGAEGIAGWDEFLRFYADEGGFPMNSRQLDYFKLLGQTRLAVMMYQTDCGFLAGRFDDIKFGISGAIYRNVAALRVGNLLRAVTAGPT